MAKNLYSLGEAYVMGEREHYEDAVQVESGVLTAGGLTLEIAIVCDGVGGRDAGEVAAQTAISRTLSAIKSSQERHIPQMLRGAVDIANREVNRLGNGGKCTLAIAVVDHDGSPFGRLYIASVGDSRIGMVRTVDKENRLQETRSLAWLNREHNVAEYQILQGVDPQLAYREHNAHSLTRVLGLNDWVDVDLGFYYKAPDVATAEQRGEDGLALRTADTIFVCSDGLLEHSPIDREPVVSEEKILRHTLDINAKEASSILVSIAQGRKTQDNTSLGMILVDPQSRYRRTTSSGRIPRVLMGALAGLVVVAFVLLGLYMTSKGQTDDIGNSLAQAQVNLTEIGNQATQAALNTALAVASFTATPTPTLTPTSTSLPVIQPGILGKYWEADQSGGEFKSNNALVSSNFAVMEVWGNTADYQANAYLSKGASVKVSSVDRTSGSYSLLAETGGFLVETGSFTSGMTVRSRGSGVEFSLAGSCMIVDNSPPKLSMACLEGTCSYAMAVGETPIVLSVGQKVTFSEDQAEPSLSKITLADVDTYIANMVRVGGQTGQIDMDHCGLRAYIPPTPRPIPTSLAATVVPGTQPISASAIPACPGSLVMQGGSCGCPSGTIRNGNECRVIEATQSTSGGSTNNGGSTGGSHNTNNGSKGSATPIPATSIPATSIPATSIPATSIPATSIPATEIPAPVICTDPNQELKDGKCVDKPPVVDPAPVVNPPVTNPPVVPPSEPGNGS